MVVKCFLDPDRGGRNAEGRVSSAMDRQQRKAQDRASSPSSRFANHFDAFVLHRDVISTDLLPRYGNKRGGEGVMLRVQLEAKAGFLPDVGP